MCHQSGGLIQRGIEAAGIPTVGLATMRDRVERVRFPRAVTVRYPRGATVGAPGDAIGQSDVILAALAHLRTADQPGAVLELPNKWPGGAS